MYLRSATISNIKQIRELTLDFHKKDGQGSRNLTVLLGRNGTGKTTILRAIAMALGGVALSTKLVKSPLELAPLPIQGNSQALPADAHEAAVEVKIQPPEGLPDIPRSWRIRLPAGKAFFKGNANADQIDDLRAENRPGLFVAGYGIQRALPGPLDKPDDSGVAIYGQLGNLFDQGALIATNFVDLVDQPKEFARAVQRALKRADLLPALKEVELRGQGGVRSSASLVESRRFELELGGKRQKIPATWLSHGYQSTIAWVVDLLGRVVQGEHGGQVSEPEQVAGVLLIDEIDIHLHPTWQRTILNGLKEAFPNLQIIATTHSPMVIADLRPDEIYLLDNDPERGITAKHLDLPPKMLTSAQLLSEFFGVQRTSAGELHADLKALQRLKEQAADKLQRAAKSRPVREQKEVLRLRQKLTDAGVDVDAWLVEGR